MKHASCACEMFCQAHNSICAHGSPEVPIVRGPESAGLQHANSKVEFHASELNLLLCPAGVPLWREPSPISAFALLAHVFHVCGG